MAFLPGYRLQKGTTLDRARLLEFAQRTYRELYPERDFAHLAQTVEQYFSSQTPLWWVEIDDPEVVGEPVACLWLGNAVDQLSGQRHAHIFLIYVAPDHRRKGIASTLVHYAERWARKRGDGQMGLQVFAENSAAIALYEKLGYRPLSWWMIKPF
ncbi:MAG: GNAT family N-acetyltransferase [Cyanobacteria bacterium SID2]|nr:GNAT family N-acetyltransferase [Cyanobacteria bacterium SID2]MBP0005081.1 GNAT family N-acetyltransferase [Cyanobacteria bacterium SBC]